jgi:hypothetical protein
MPLMFGSAWQGHIAEKEQAAIGSEGFGDDAPLVTRPVLEHCRTRAATAVRSFAGNDLSAALAAPFVWLEPTKLGTDRVEARVGGAEVARVGWDVSLPPSCRRIEESELAV